MSAFSMGIRRIVITLNPVASPQRISDQNLFTAEFKISAPTANTGAVFYLGDKGVDATYMPRPKGTIHQLMNGDGTNDGTALKTGYNLRNLWVLNDAGGAITDKIIVEYSVKEKIDQEALIP